MAELMQLIKAELAVGALLSANDRLDWHAEMDRKQALVQIGKFAFARKFDRVERRQHVEITYCFPTRDRAGRSQANRKRDAANWAPTSKCLVDGLVRGGVLPDDNDAWVLGPDNRLGPPSQRPNMVEVWVMLSDAPPKQVAEKTQKRDTRVQTCCAETQREYAGAMVRYYCSEDRHDASVKHRAMTDAGEIRW